MKICILTHTFPRYLEDTAAPFMRGVAEGMVSNSKVFVLTPYSKEFKKSNNENYNLQTYKYIWPSFFHKLGYSETLENDMSLKPLVYLLSPLMFLGATLALYNLVKKEKIDIINAHWILPNGFIACLVGKLTGVPVVSTLPGSDVYMADKNILFRWMARFAAENSLAITSNSPQLLKDLADITKVNRRKLSTIIYGVDPDKFKPLKKEAQSLRKKLSILEDELVVLGVGRLVSKKGFKYLIQAVPAVLKKNKKVKIIIVGEGDQRQELEKLIERFNLEKKVILVGNIDYKNLVRYYNLSDIFILPSVRDEKGNLDDQSVSVMEAMACGKPIITTNFPGYREVIKDKENGLLVKEGHVKEITNAILKIANSNSLRKKMGQKSREMVLNNYSWKSVGQQYVNLFQKLNLNKSYSDALPNILDVKDRKRVANQILKVLQNKKNNLKELTCLDIGCSSGVIANFLSDYFKKIIGVDIDQKALEIADQKYKKSNISFVRVDNERLPFKDGSFDVIICNQVYNFVEDYNLLVKEIYRVLKSGGICFFSARNKYAFVEPQYKLPFLSWLPEEIARIYLRVMNKGGNFLGKNYLSLSGLRNLVKIFEVEDLTIKILKNPDQYGYTNLKKYAFITKLLPLNTIEFLIPNYIWILNKKR